MFIGQKASQDRLRRVQGLSKTLTETDRHVDLDDVIMRGDPLLFVKNNIPKLGSIVSISKGGKKVSMLKGEDIQRENVLFIVKQLQLDDNGSMLIWSGQHANDTTVQVSGKDCHTIQPGVQIHEQSTVYTFDKGLVFDLGISMQSDIPSSSSASASARSTSSDSTAKQCFHCTKMVPLEGGKMWAHVGAHILRGECGDPPHRNPCGYCGRSVCDNKLGSATKKQDEVFFRKVTSNCPFMHHVARKAKKASARHPCLNYLVKCALCKADVFAYNMEHHYEDVHPDFAERPKVDPEEIKLMMKQK